MQPVGPIKVVPLFAGLGEELVALLRGLAPEDWSRPTACALWSVRDVAAHLLDGNVRRLSFQRDRLPLLAPETEIESYDDLVAFLNQLNAEWVRAAKRISPALLIELLGFTDAKVQALFESLDPRAPAMLPVAWAGEETSQNWFDLAREYTEKWLHQQQIRDAVERPGLTSRRWFYPVLDTFMRALPHLYRDAEADEGASLAFRIKGEAGGWWSLLLRDGSWRLFHGEAAAPLALATLDQDDAWRLFTKSLDPETARGRARIEGDEELGAKMLGLVAVMA